MCSNHFFGVNLSTFRLAGRRVFTQLRKGAGDWCRSCGWDEMIGYGRWLIGESEQRRPLGALRWKRHAWIFNTNFCSFRLPCIRNDESCKSFGFRFVTLNLGAHRILQVQERTRILRPIPQVVGMVRNFTVAAKTRWNDERDLRWIGYQDYTCRGNFEFFHLFLLGWMFLVCTGAGYIGERTPKMCQGSWSPHLSGGKMLESSSNTLYIQMQQFFEWHYHYHHNVGP